MEFLDVVDARRDGTAFELRGSGEVAVLTPPMFEPGSAYRVVFTDDGGARLDREVLADGEGRLPIVVDLDRGGLHDLPGDAPERLGLQPAGAWRVRVL